ncbi:MAG: RNA-guided endonuclease InsQ/TnpB family protein [Caulobacteraceae bacterium]
MSIMRIHRSSVFRLYPTAFQAEQMTRFAGACRFIYNLCLEQRRDWWRPGRSINFASQCREVTQLRAEVDWLSAVPADTLHQAVQNLDRAYRNWWAGLAKAPKPHKKGDRDGFRISHGRDVLLRRTGQFTGQVRLPKLGWISLRGWRLLGGAIRSATVSLRAGQWHVAIEWQREAGEPAAPTLPPVGIDQGVTIFAALSDGTKIAPTNAGKKAMRALAKAQRSLARKRRGSNNRRRAARRVAKIHVRVSNARKDFLHKVSTTIAKNHGLVFVEALKVRNMTASAKGTVAEPGKSVRQKAGLNRAILDQGWGMFRTMLAYKLEERGGNLIEVSAAYTSQTCHACGTADPESRKSQSRFICTSCGHEDNADTNAAKNILKRGLDKSLKRVDGSPVKGPVEARSIRSVA